ncbi:Alpha/Beta hydrolase protein [Cladochytrium replicatum]|nr:Alpha/Beta hydrolase protein [Cladochytrium replicatum]
MARILPRVLLSAPVVYTSAVVALSYFVVRGSLNALRTLVVGTKFKTLRDTEEDVDCGKALFGFFEINLLTLVIDRFPHSEIGTHKHADVNGVRIHYVINGPTSAPIVLLIHGYPENWFSWRHQLRDLSDQFRVAAVDLRGYGTSSKPRAIKSYIRKEVTKDIIEIIGELGGGKVILVGHDWGGIVAQAVATDAPDLVRKLILVNTPNADIFFGNMTLYRYLVTNYMQFFQLPYVPEAFLLSNESKWFYDLYGSVLVTKNSISKSEVEFMRKSFRIPNAATALLNYYRAAYQGERGGWRNFSQLGPIPTMVLWGEKDHIIVLENLIDSETPRFDVSVAGICSSNATDSFRDKKTGVWVVKIPHCGHFPQIDDPALISKAIRTFAQA